MNIREFTLKDNSMSVSFSCSDSIMLTSLKDLTTGHDYVTAPTPFFAYADEFIPRLDYGRVDFANLFHKSDKDLDVTINNTDNSAILAIKSTVCPQFEMELSLKVEDGKLFANVKTRNVSVKDHLFKLMLPCLSNIAAEGTPDKTLVSTPQEVGNLEFFQIASDKNGLGLGVHLDSGLPSGHPSVGSMTVYDPDSGNGLYLVDATGGYEKGGTPLYFASKNHILSANYAAELPAGSEKTSPTLAIGFSHGEDWHAGADYWLSLQPEVTYPAPDWLRYAGAIYANRIEGAGAGYLSFHGTAAELPKQLKKDFRNLPELLEDAKKVGTDVIYLVDWYEKGDSSWMSEEEKKDRPYIDNYYWNKGDYVPRLDMGGEKALIEGIKAVHDAGGHVMVYVEEFITFKLTEIAKSKGADWCAYHANGTPLEDYPFNYTMLYDNEEWQDYLAKTCLHLVRDYGIDGIFYDSTGWQWNRRFYDKNGNLHSSEENAYGIMKLLKKTRDAIRSVKPDAIIMGESGSGPMLWHLDGGLTCDNGWANTGSIRSLVSAPARYAFPNGNLFSCGINFNELYQFFAAGVNLALSPRNLDMPGLAEGQDATNIIRQLVDIRKEYKDALIDGKLIREPQTGSVYVPSYLFVGESNTILNICSTLGTVFNAQPILGSDYANTCWRDARTGNEYRADADGKLNVAIAAKDLAVLIKL